MTDAPTSPCTILVVEDDNDIREALSQVLLDEGYQVLSAPNGSLALEEMRQQLPDLVLLDLMMPVMNGWQFREQQLQDPALADVPVIVISADTTAQQEADDLGVRAFLRKPVELMELLDTVARHAGCEAGSSE